MAPRARFPARLLRAGLLAAALVQLPLATDAGASTAAAAPPAAAPMAPLPGNPEGHASDRHPGDVQTAQPIDGRRSSAEFVVTMRLRGVVAGRIAGVAGALAGSAATGWRVQVRLDAKGLRFDGPGWMARTTRSASFLAVDRYPSIRFESDAFDGALLRSGGPLRGLLTLRGLRRPVSFALLPSDCARPGFDCDIRVQGSVSRREFGMSAYRVMVADPVELRIRVRLRPGPPA